MPMQLPAIESSAALGPVPRGVYVISEAAGAATAAAEARGLLRRARRPMYNGAGAHGLHPPDWQPHTGRSHARTA